MRVVRQSSNLSDVREPLMRIDPGWTLVAFLLGVIAGHFI